MGLMPGIYLGIFQGLYSSFLMSYQDREIASQFMSVLANLINVLIYYECRCDCVVAASINIKITGEMIIFVCLELDNIHW